MAQLNIFGDSPALDFGDGGENAFAVGVSNTAAVGSGTSNRGTSGRRSIARQVTQKPDLNSLDPAPMGRIQDTQVCPDPNNERVALCAGGREVSVYSPLDSHGNMVLESTLTGFTGAVVRCAWHFHVDATTGDKTYLLASVCDDGQVLVHQQILEYTDGADGDCGGSYIASHWVVTFGHRRADAKAFSWGPVAALEWMSAGALDAHTQTLGQTELPFALALGSNKLVLVFGFVDWTFSVSAS